MFSQILGIAGVQAYTQEMVLGLQVSPWAVVIAILVIVFILGMFIDATPITVIFLPIFFPIVDALGLTLYGLPSFLPWTFLSA